MMVKPLRYFALRPTRLLDFVSSVMRASLSPWGLLFLAVHVFWAVTVPPVLAQDASKSPLVIMGDKDYPPYESLVDGEPAGINVDLWREIAKILGRPLDLRLYQWADSQARVQRGEAKVLTFMSINKERAKLYDFTEPTFTSRFPMFVLAEIVNNIDVSDLTGKRIAVKKGGFPRTIVETLHPEAVMVFVESAREGFRKLLRGEVDGVMEDERVGYTILRENDLQGIMATPRALAVKTGHIAVAKGNPALLRQIDEALAVLKSTGKFDQIADSWAGLDTVLIKRETIRSGIVLGLAAIVLILGLGGVVYVLRMRRTNFALRKEITERERAQEALRESETRLAEAHRIANIGHWAWDEKEDRQLYCSEEGERIFGLLPGTVFANFDEFLAMIHPDDRERVEAVMDQAHEDRTCYEIEYEIVRPDGEIRLILERTDVELDDAGELARTIGTVQDLTEQKRAEEALRRAHDELELRVDERTAELRASEEQLRLITDNLPVLIGYVDRDRRYVFANKAYEEWFDRPRKKILGRPVKEIVGDVAYQQVEKHLETAFAGEVETYEALLPFGYGGERYIEASYIPDFEDGKAVKGCHVLVHDITKRKRAEEKARRHQAELAHILRVSTVGEMAVALAHELNQPLAAVVNHSRACARRIRSGREQSAHISMTLDQICEQAERASNIIRRIADLVHKSEPKRRPLEANQIVRALAPLALADAHENDVLLRFDLTGEGASVLADVVEIEQVILNLVRNAIEAMTETEGGKRELTVRTSMAGDDAVEVAVRDTGRGIPPEIVDRVFDPFFTTKNKGLGMGLAISQSIVEAHGGRLTATRNKDRGTTFRFTLPAVHEQSGTQTAAQRLDSPRRVGVEQTAMKLEPTVFVVDDDEAARESLRSLVESVDVNVEAYAAAREFLDAYEPDRPGCLVLDLRMPTMGGLDLQEELAAREITIPVIVVTGYGNVPEAVRALKAGAVDLIEKPFNDQALLNRIQECLQLDALRHRQQEERIEILKRLKSLSSREREAMELVIAGQTSKAIARKLGISPGTVEKHRAQVMAKMKAGSVVSLVQMSFICGIAENTHIP